jgi:murein DD-endopeptidase MepM/ murein hydrolase activator NlpD
MNRRLATAVFISLTILLTTRSGVLEAVAQTVTEVKHEIDSINQDVSKKKQDRETLKRQADRYRTLIMEKKQVSANLEDELGLLDSDIARNQLDIEIAKDEIAGLDIAVRALDQRIGEHERQMAKQRLLIGSLARRLYRAQFSRSPFETLLTNASLSEFFDAWQAGADLQSGLTKASAQLKTLTVTLQDERGRKAEKQRAIEEQKRAEEVAMRELEDVKSLKAAILMETKQSEIEYRYALAELDKEQNEADSEIRYLEKALREKKSLAERLGRSATVLSWPVEPTRGLSALFHDPEYPFRQVFEHSAVDIRAYQNTAVRAAASGVVARAKNGGMGYSYVMIIHNNDISTVYGHLVRITAKEDSFVERGEIIGYSGGMPGTPGAGRLTTGPHLHFEVREAGLPVNPLRYLPALE